MGTEQLEMEVHPIVNQLTATADLASRHPFPTLRILDLNVVFVHELLAEYKGVALSYDVLSDAVKQNDTTMVLRLMTKSKPNLNGVQRGHLKERCSQNTHSSVRPLRISRLEMSHIS